MARYLITGGCGFIGSHLADILVAAGHQVRILDDLSTGRLENAPKLADILVGDVADGRLTARAMRNVDGCFHLAAVPWAQKPYQPTSHRINVEGIIRVLDAARIGPVPVVFASSAAVYGNQRSSQLREICRPAPVTSFGADTLDSETHACMAGLAHSVPTIGLRFFNVYGPRQGGDSPHSSVIPIFIERLLAGASLDIYGSGRQSRDFLHVLDAVRFLIGAMQRIRLEPQVFNACTGQATSIHNLAKRLAQICKTEPLIRFHAARIGDILNVRGAPELAALHLGIRARITLSDGLRHTVESSLSDPSLAHRSLRLTQAEGSYVH